MRWPQVGDTIRLVCPVGLRSRVGTARRGLEIGAEGVVEQIYPLGEVFEVRFGERLVTVARTEFTEH